MNPYLISFLIVASNVLTGMYTNYRQKRKYAAEAQKLEAETQKSIGETYGDLLDELNKQLESVNEKLLAQGIEIKRLQDANDTYLKLIGTQALKEADMIKQISALRATQNKAHKDEKAA